jgi:hypothetical protein
VPLIASIAVGPAIGFDPAESKLDFLARAQRALSNLQRP